MQNGLGAIAEDGDEQRERGERFFAAGEKQNILQALARRLRDDVNAAVARAIGLAEAHLAVAAAEKRLERDGELRVDEGEGVLEFLARDFVEFVNGELRILDGLHEIVALAAHKTFALLAFLEFLERHHVDGAHGFDARLHLVEIRFGGDQLFADEKLRFLGDQFLGLRIQFGDAALAEIVAVGIVAGFFDLALAALGAKLVERLAAAAQCFFDLSGARACFGPFRSRTRP